LFRVERIDKGERVHSIGISIHHSEFLCLP
jgi:hypothetical protein